MIKENKKIGREEGIEHDEKEEKMAGSFDGECIIHFTFVSRRNCQ